MGINLAKSWFAVERSDKRTLFFDYINIKKGHSVFFFILYSKKYVEVTGIQVTMKMLKMFW